MNKIFLLIVIIASAWFFRYSLERIIISPLAKSSKENALVEMFFNTCISNLPNAQKTPSTVNTDGWNRLSMEGQILKETPNGIILGTWSRDEPYPMALYTSEDAFPNFGKVNICVVGMADAHNFFVLPTFLSKFNLGAPVAEEKSMVGTIHVHKYDWLTTVQGKESILAIKTLSGDPASYTYLFVAVPQ